MTTQHDLSPTQIEALRAAAGPHGLAVARTWATLNALKARGFIDNERKITAAGREVLAEALGVVTVGREFRRGVPPFYSNLPPGTPRLTVVCPGTATEHNANDCRNRVFAICAGCILGMETL